MFFTLHLIYFHPVSQPQQLLLPYFVGEEIVTQPSMTWPHAQTMQRGGGLRVHSDDRTVRQSLAAANELRQTRAHPGPNHGEHWDVGQTAHTLNILSAWVDASWGVISVTTEVPQKAKDEWVTEMLTRSSKTRRDSRSQNGSAFSPVSPEGAMGGFSNGMVLENEQRNAVAYEAWTQVH